MGCPKPSLRSCRRKSTPLPSGSITSKIRTSGWRARPSRASLTDVAGTTSYPSSPKPRTRFRKSDRWSSTTRIRVMRFGAEQVARASSAGPQSGEGEEQKCSSVILCLHIMAGYAVAQTLRRIHLVPASGFMGCWPVFDPLETPAARRGSSNRPPLIAGYLKRLWKSGFLYRILLDSDSAMPAGWAPCLCECLAISAVQRSKSTTTLWAAMSFAPAAARRFASRSRPTIANPVDRTARGRMRVPMQSLSPFKCRPRHPRKNAKAVPRRENRRPAPPAVGTRSAFLPVC